MSVTEHNLVIAGNTFSAKIEFNLDKLGYSVISPEYDISNVARIAFEAIKKRSYEIVILFKHKKIIKNDIEYILWLKSNILGSPKKYYLTENCITLKIENCNIGSTIDVSIRIESHWRVTNFADRHDDDMLTDFEMRGENGSIQVHKVALAAASPVMSRMLCGEWKETVEGFIEIQATTQTLQNLKSFIYRSTLPETESDLKELILIATRYCIQSLEIKCIEKLADGLTKENTFALLEFAMANQYRELVFLILDLTNKPRMQELRQYYEEKSSDIVNEQ